MFNNIYENKKVLITGQTGFKGAWLTVWLLKLGANVIGVSKDSVTSHNKFRAKYSLPFDLVSDEKSELCNQYGVWVEKSMFGKKYMGIERSTFLINKNQEIVKEWRKVKVKNHVEDVLTEVGKL